MSDYVIDDTNLRDYLLYEYARPFSGWDFSSLRGRRESLRVDPGWDYATLVREAMREARVLLDMDTGGGEFLASLAPLPPETIAIEGYAPNVPHAQQQLTPLRVQVIAMAANEHLAFPDAHFDLITNRHGAYDPQQVRRILKQGKWFITQQVGSQTNVRLHQLLHAPGKDKHWTLSVAVAQLEGADFRILEQREQAFVTRYHDIGAVVYYLKAVPWEIPDFSVNHYYDRLVAIHHQIQRDGYLDVPFHTFLVIAEKI